MFLVFICLLSEPNFQMIEYSASLNFAFVQYAMIHPKKKKKRLGYDHANA